MSDFVIRHGFLDRYNGPGGDIVIPEEVTDFTPYCGVGLRQCMKSWKIQGVKHRSSTHIN